MRIVPRKEEARDHVHIVAKDAMAAEGWRTHGNDPARDIGQVEVEAMSLESPFVL